MSRPKWFNRMLLVTLLLVAASGVGCYFWGLKSVDTNAVIKAYLASESLEVQRGRYAGAAVSLVANETISTAWVNFCNNVIEDCASILQER